MSSYKAFKYYSLIANYKHRLGSLEYPSVKPVAQTLTSSFLPQDDMMLLQSLLKQIQALQASSNDRIEMKPFRQTKPEDRMNAVKNAAKLVTFSDYTQLARVWGITANYDTQKNAKLTILMHAWNRTPMTGDMDKKVRMMRRATIDMIPEHVDDEKRSMCKECLQWQQAWCRWIYSDAPRMRLHIAASLQALAYGTLHNTHAFSERLYHSMRHHVIRDKCSIGKFASELAYSIVKLQETIKMGHLHQDIFEWSISFYFFQLMSTKFEPASKKRIQKNDAESEKKRKREAIDLDCSPSMFCLKQSPFFVDKWQGAILQYAHLVRNVLDVYAMYFVNCSVERLSDDERQELTENKKCLVLTSFHDIYHHIYNRLHISDVYPEWHALVQSANGDGATKRLQLRVEVLKQALAYALFIHFARGEGKVTKITFKHYQGDTMQQCFVLHPRERKDAKLFVFDQNI